MKKILMMMMLMLVMISLVACGKETPEGMVLVEGGTFRMGGTKNNNEKPIHSVTLDSFYIGKYEVTQGEFEAIMGFNPSRFKGDSLPVEKVTWYDATVYCNELSKIEGLTPYYIISNIKKERNNIINANVSISGGKGYRLPTEAEWEYAARGGNKSKGYKYSGSDNIDTVSWYSGNSGSKTQTVGTKSANELGIYDMSGNVWEWCWDWYDSEYYSKSASSNPTGPSSGSDRVGRGGSWLDSAGRCEVSYRNFFYPDYRIFGLGFRVLRTY